MHEDESLKYTSTHRHVFLHLSSQVLDWCEVLESRRCGKAGADGVESEGAGEGGGHLKLAVFPHVPPSLQLVL